MNNKNTSIIWRFVYVLLILLYLIVIFVSVRAIINIPHEYDRKQEEQTLFYKETIKKGVKENDIDILSDLDDKYPIEFIIYNMSDDKTVYSTLSENNMIELKGSLNKNAVAAEEFFKLEDNGKSYEVWMVQYHISPQSVVNTWMTRIVAIVFMLVAVNFVAMTILYIKFLQPLRRLKDNVTKISKYQLDLLSAGDRSEYDQISNQLALFAKDLERHISDSEMSYTTLEKNLQVQNEKLNYRTRMVAELTHDLKSPLTNIFIAVEQDKKNNKDENELRKYNYFQNQIQKVITDINDIGKLVYQDNDIDFFKKEEFDVVQLLMDTYETFKMQFKNKNYIVQNDIDNEVIIKTVKLSMKQIIHNSLSNIAAYGKENGEVIISCYIEGEYLYLAFYNEATPLTDEQLENVFKLFYRISTSKTGLGTGLYTVKNIANELGGEVSFKNKDKGVILEFYFKLDHIN